jgi:hypothetical protein
VLRRFVVKAVLYSGTLGATLPVPAQVKVSPIEAQYQDQPKGGLSCALCSLFRPPRSCEIVEGDISPNGWCRFFDLSD